MDAKTKKFFSYYRPYKKIFFMDMLCATIASGVSLTIPMITRYVTNEVLYFPDNQLISTIAYVGSIMIALTILEFACNYYITYKGHMMGASMEADMRNELYQHYTKLSFSFYDNQKVGQLMTRLTNDLFSLTELYHHGPEDIIISSIKIIGAFILLLFVNVQLTICVFILIPIMLAFAIHYNRRMKKAFKANRQKIGDINARIEDSLSGIRVVKSFGNEKHEMHRFNKENNQWLATRRKTYLLMGRYQSGLNGFISLLSIVVVIGGSLMITKQVLNAGDLIAYLLYMSNLTEPIKKLVNFTETFQDGVTGYERFYELLSIAPDIKDETNARDLTDVRGDVSFKHVYFRYEETNEDVLTDINLDVKAGEYVALVGQSGAGKTTLCSLIPRFYDITSGDITIDQISIKDIKLQSLRDNIGIVQQDVYLFAGTIMENIAYGREDASEEEIIMAAKMANAHDFIEEMPDGYFTDIGSRGIKLSGGQKQRLSIARVFLKNPKLLIFDEATSALDNESEQVVQESLERLAQNRTTFVIAHRLSTIKNAQRIVVLGSNGIEETGTHEALLRAGGEYAKLYGLQFR